MLHSSTSLHRPHFFLPSSATAIVLIRCSVFCFEHDVRTAVNKNGRGSSVCVVGPLTYISTWPTTNYGARATSLSRSPAYPTSIVPTHFYTIRPIQIFIHRFCTSRYVRYHGTLPLLEKPSLLLLSSSSSLSSSSPSLCCHHYGLSSSSPSPSSPSPSSSSSPPSSPPPPL